MGHLQESSPVPHLSDEELEYYGDLYLTRGIREAGVDFASYLNNPEYYLTKYGKTDEVPDGRANDDRAGIRQLIRLRSASRTPSG